MEKPENPIIFLETPPSLREEMEALSFHGEGAARGEKGRRSFTVDPAILLPVELEAPLEEGAAELAENLSWERILSGMIKVIALYEAGASPVGRAGDFPYPVVQPGWIDYYRRFVLALRPGILKEFTQAAIFKARNGDFDLALEVLEGLWGLCPGSPVVLLNKALVLERKAAALERNGREGAGWNARALAVYEDLLNQKPVFPNALFNAGFFFMKGHNFRRAKECFSAFLPLGEDPEKTRRAEQLLEEIERRGLDEDSLHEAYEAILRGDEEEGLFRAKEFLEQNPEVWNGWFILGWALRKLRRWEDGAAAFNKALELGGENADALNELAICLMETGDLAGGRKALERALEAEGENIKIISNLGVLAMKEGSDDEAAAFFRIVLDLDPEDPVAAAYFDGNLKG
jgi:tetratricopeptide (TPR) repeat protein